MNDSLFTNIPLQELLSKVKAIVREEVQVLNKPETKPESELLTIKQVCQLTGACLATIHNWKRKRILPFYRLGRKIRFKKDEVLSAMKKIERKEVY